MEKWSSMRPVKYHLVKKKLSNSVDTAGIIIHVERIFVDKISHWLPAP